MRLLLYGNTGKLVIMLNPSGHSVTPNPLSGVVVGFEQPSYNVDENVGQFDVCVVVTVPSISEALDRMFSLSVSTRPGTAGMSLKLVLLTKLSD